SAHLDNHYLGCSRRLRPIGGEPDAVDVDNRGTPEREHSSYSLRLLLLCSRFRCSGIDRNTHGLTTTQAHDLGRNIAVRQGDKSKRADFDLLPGRQRLAPERMQNSPSHIEAAPVIGRLAPVDANRIAVEG